MKALTIRQPWASLIALGVKHIETRSWRASQSLIGQTIAIHAGMHRPIEGEEYGTGWWWHPDEFSINGPVIIEQSAATWREAHAPLGAIVATATLADCLPIGPGPEQWVDHGRCYVSMWPEGELKYRVREDFDGPDSLVRDLTDQLPYGDFQPGRWAWMLTDVQPCDPVPAKGKQGLWNWDGA